MNEKVQDITLHYIVTVVVFALSGKKMKYTAPCKTQYEYKDSRN